MARIVAIAVLAIIVLGGAAFLMMRSGDSATPTPQSQSAPSGSGSYENFSVPK